MSNLTFTPPSQDNPHCAPLHPLDPSPPLRSIALFILPWIGVAGVAFLSVPTALLHLFLLRTLSRQQRRPGTKTNWMLMATIPTALLVPEILERILSFLDPTCQRKIAGRVCKEWQALVQHFERLRIRNFVHVTWVEDAKKKRLEEVLDSLQSAHVLTLLPTSVTSMTHSYLARASSSSSSLNTDLKTERRWRLMDTIRRLTFEQRQNVQQISIVGELVRYEFMNPILSELSSLSLLRLEMDPGKGSEPQFLQTILKTCPRLEELFIGPLTHKGAGGRRLEPLDEKCAVIAVDETRLPMLPLRVFTTHNMAFTQRSLEVVLLSMPRLRVLRIVGARRATREQAGASALLPVDIRKLFEAMARACLFLEEIHFSMKERRLSGIEVATLVLEAFPGLKRWGFLDLDGRLPGVMSCLYAVTHHLTSLEFYPSGAEGGLSTGTGARTGTVRMDGLHEILCASPNLLHLKAPLIPFWSEQMDINHVLSGQGALPTTTTTTAASRIMKRVWTCQNLLTLHLTFAQKHTATQLLSSHTSPSSIDSARVLFGYLSKVCPRLQELHLSRSGVILDWGLESGFCLLTRLQNLSSLILTTKRLPRFRKETMGWMERFPSVQRDLAVDPKCSCTCCCADGRGSSEVGMASTTSSVVSSSGIVPTLTEQGKLRLMLRHLGRQEDLYQWRHERASRNFTCWPQWIHFRVQYEIGSVKEKKEAERFLKMIRPEVEIELEQSPVPD